MPIITIELMNGRIEKVHGVPDEYEVYVHDFDHLGETEPYTIKLYDPEREASFIVARVEQTGEPFINREDA